MNLYRVMLNGMYRASYVVAPNAEMAYLEVRAYLTMHDIGEPEDRALKTVELLAEDNEYSECGTRLFITRNIKRTPPLAVKRKTDNEDTD